ncbi:hypothetical protein [Acidipila sp. EB88]|uniref:hypothetical protein n=1 Tax=Acidipila sp. EB88 TaxID=2305226 RepID=UPI000F5EEEB8|nr:hypothetical protein [Acidipila sp. EB88]RRA47581.1 hypothetical protein D1Y84_04000 [Acidipila sp. EB88]
MKFVRVPALALSFVVIASLACYETLLTQSLKRSAACLFVAFLVCVPLSALLLRTPRAQAADARAAHPTLQHPTQAEAGIKGRAASGDPGLDVRLNPSPSPNAAPAPVSMAGPIPDPVHAHQDARHPLQREYR